MSGTARRRALVATQAAAKAADRHVTLMVALLLGVVATGCGVLFTTMPDRLASIPSLATLFMFTPPVFWGVIYLALGVSLLATAAVAFRRSYALCGLLAATFHVQAVLSAFSVVDGQGAGFVPWLCTGYGWLGVITALAIYAPRWREPLEKELA